MAQEDTTESRVTRTYRAAIRLGEDFITLEETITLPLYASDEEIQQAVALGWRIYQSQHESIHSQIAALRETYGAPTSITIRDPDAPASEKQRNYITVLQHELAWTDEQLAEYAYEQAIPLPAMTRGQASGFIDGLKRLAEERTAYYQTAGPRVQDLPTEEPDAPSSSTTEEPVSTPAGETHAMTTRQFQALTRLSQRRGVELDAFARQHLGVAATDLSYDQASHLITELQRPGRS